MLLDVKVDCRVLLQCTMYGFIKIMQGCVTGGLIITQGHRSNQ